MAAQYARPDSDISNPDGWAPDPSTPTTLFDKIDETPYSDTDFIYSDNGQGTYVCTLGLSEVDDPESSDDHVIRWRAELYGTGNKVVYTRLYLYQGATLKATSAQEQEASQVTTHTYTLTGTEADSITDYTDLRFLFEAYLTGTGTRVARVTWAEFEVPEAAGGEYQQSCSGAITPTGATVKKPEKHTAGAVVPTGAILRAVKALKAGSMQPAGSLLAAEISKLLSGSITPTGALDAVKSYVRQLAGAITPSGSLEKGVKKVLAGASGATGTLARMPRKLLSGNLTPIGEKIAGLKKLLSGALAPSGALTGKKAYFRQLAGGLTPTAELMKKPAKALAGVIAPAGQLIKSAKITLFGSLAPAGSLIKGIKKLLSGALAAAGALIGNLGGGGVTGTVNLTLKPRDTELSIRSRRGLEMSLRTRTFSLDVRERED